MIRSYKKLTGKYLKANKKRSMLTVVGIVLSVALISTIGFFILGIQNAEIESIKNDYGSWHVMYNAPDEDLVSKVTNNPKVSRSGFFEMDKDIKVYKDVSVSPIDATDKALELLPCKIKSGRFPENSNEAAVEGWVLKYMVKDAKLGDEIKLDNSKYKLVGILRDSVSSQIKKSGIFLSKNNNIDKSRSVLLAEISSKTNLEKAVSELDNLPKNKTVKINGKATTSFVNNSPLIDIEGGGSDRSAASGVYATVAVIIGIVVIATIAVIYNSFQISVVERIKQFGLLRAIGMTPLQIKKMVFGEASILSLIGIPLGLICGIIAICIIQVIFKSIGGDSVMPMKLEISPEVMLISAAVALVSIYMSALLPALFAGRISPLAAISGRTSITKENIKKRRKNMIVSKLFKFEGDLAYKNIKRNKKRYRITVFSIVISVVLFITFKSFMDMTLNVSESLNESNNIHFSVQSNGENSFVNNQIIKDIGKLSPVDKMYKIYNEYNFTQFIDKNKEIGEVKSISGIYGKGTAIDGKEKISMNGAVGIYDKNALQISKKYIQSGSIDVNKLNNENGVILINKNIIYNKKVKKSYTGPVADIKAGDEIELIYSGETNTTLINSENVNIKNSNRKPTEKKGEIKKVKVMAVLKDDPFDFVVQTGPKLITSREVAQKLTGIDDIKPVGLNITIKDVKNENNAKNQIENVIKSDPALSIINHLDHNRTQKSAILMIKILIYGFVVVVSLIGSVNIINTLTTNIILRKREFAALKSIGLTEKGLKKMIVLEGLLYGMVGTIYGSIISCGLSYMMYMGMYTVREFRWQIPWTGIAIAAVAAVVIGYLSVLSPLARINRENLIDSIREDY